jgi:hypothetical protein
LVVAKFAGYLSFYSQLILEMAVIFLMFYLIKRAVSGKENCFNKANPSFAVSRAYRLQSLAI